MGLMNKYLPLTLPVAHLALLFLFGSTYAWVMSWLMGVGLIIFAWIIWTDDRWRAKHYPDQPEEA